MQRPDCAPAVLPPRAQAVAPSRRYATPWPVGAVRTPDVLRPGSAYRSGVSAYALSVDYGTSNTVAVLPWPALAAVDVRRRGVNRRPTLFALPRDGGALPDDPFWRSRSAPDGRLRVADLKTLRADPAAVRSAAEQYLP